ncbi:MAG: patatin-like phospholipase family protein [Rikenellaceae bacterium]|nr:patatin-like phospholipase family protein [Rikenellaceae bacterium]
MDKCVSLALSSGGPRGFAYIGAIEELTSRGYRIGSVAGTSIGSLVGGIYAAGKLDEFKEWLFALDAWKVFTLMDLSIGKNHIVKGERIIEAMREIVPDVDIESLPIPFRAVATDLYTGEEVVFDHGKLFEAIRASISIPSLFQPVKHGLTTLVDGCIANCLPLSRVVRSEGDILVAFDVNDVDVAEIRSILARENAALVADTAFEQSTRAEMRGILDSVTNRSDIGLVERLKSAGSRSMSLIKDVINYEEEYDEAKALDYGDTYYDLLDRSFSLMNHRQSELSIALYHPDIVVKMPFDAYGEIADYAKAKEISEIGRQLMREALDRYEGK